MRINIQKQSKQRIFPILFAVLMLLVVVRYVLQVDFPWEILLVVVALIALVGDRDEIIALSLCCIPLYTSMQYIYALAICIACYAIKYSKDIRFNGSIIPILLLLAWEWLHCFDEYSSVMGAVRMMIPLVLCLLLTACPTNKISYPFVARVFALCVTMMCLIVLGKLLVNAGFNIQKAFSNMQRLGTASEEADILGADFNPNFLGFICIIASTGLIQLRMDRQGRKMDMVMAVFLLLCGMLTLSRTYLICLALMIVLFVVANATNIVKLLKLSGMAVGIGILALLLMMLFFPKTVEDWVGRFLVEDITSGRLALMARYNERIFENPDIYLFGLGVQSVADKVVARFGAGKILGTVVPHNAIQEMIFCWGIPGLIIFVVFLWGMIVNAKRKNPGIKLLNYIPLILLLVKVQAGQLITTPANVLIFSYAFLSMCYEFKGETAQK